MLDIKYIRDHIEEVKNGLRNRGVDISVIDNIIHVDEERRIKMKEVEDARARQNVLSEAISKMRADDRQEKITESKELKTNIDALEKDSVELEGVFRSYLIGLPNIPFPEVPVGKDESANKVIREVGEKPIFDFTPRDYMAVAEALNLIDTQRAAKVSGSRFGYLKNEAVSLEFALVQYAFSHLKKYGFSSIVPPVFIKEEMMRAMGYIDSEKDEAERYYFEKDKLYLVGTAEQSLGPMHAEETFGEDKLPLRYAGFSTCFRREAGSYGKDTRGILRVHQFDKIEMFVFAKPEESKNEHDIIIHIEEELMRGLGIPYRVVALCTGDLSQPSAATYDIESWLPGQNEGKGQYRETHSSSNTTDFQARRLNIKVKNGGKLEFVHVLNGTAFAIGRTIITILENYQQKDGSVRVPEVLVSHMGGITEIRHS